MITFILLSNLIFWTFILLNGILGFRSIKRLEDIQTIDKTPLLSIIVAARNEEDSIAKSLETQFTQTYHNLEWIVVNDRSTDDTGRVLEKLQIKNNRLKVIHISKLPTGWLGKNHAMYQGYLHSKGDYLLFTDADVMYQPEVIHKAMSFLQMEEIDHLTIAPNLSAQTFWLKTFVSFFLFGFSYFKRPWLANKDRSKIGTGIGAFNLLSRQAYEQIGTHKAISLRPDDDLQLGFKIKATGLKQRIVSGLSLLSVDWYPSLRAAFTGLEKNTFAGLHYRVSMVFLAIIGTFVSTIFPYITLFTGDSIHFLLSILIIFLLGCSYTLTTKKITTFSPLLFIVFPITSLLFIYSIARASILTFIRGGVMWRGTKYSLKELRKMDKI
ncbi:glycosyltransferase [Fredinandcohnia sp. 179-A 10B2 NHS]|uniref:glycosyltransferase n=1 Tax=Fredinandcohnia sp. 179-A 10B2 NHS TaxID=3235176 RepID=UPI0039A2A290